MQWSVACRRRTSFLRSQLLPRVSLSSSSSSWSSSSSSSDKDVVSEEAATIPNNPQRVWMASSSSPPPSSTHNHHHHWTRPVYKQESYQDMERMLEQIGTQELHGGRMRQSQLGVLHEDPGEDMRLLMENYTVPSLASALRDREDVLQQCAELAKEQEWEQLESLLKPFQRDYVLERRIDSKLDLSHGFDGPSLDVLKKALTRMPRRVTHAHSKRAGVVLPLCNVHGVPSVLLEKRSSHLRSHPDEVCLPGGMVCNLADTTIIATCLREMQEEIPGLSQQGITTLGILRCNWGEVHHLVGVAVTPLVCFVGELGDASLEPNPSEVAQVFTVPLSLFLDRKRWIHREGLAPIFVGGPHIIWGLTGYIIERFMKDILARFSVTLP